MKDNNRNEISYYDEIISFLSAQIESNFRAMQHPLKVFCKKGELKKGLQEIISENKIETEDIIEFSRKTPPLSLDIFALITDGKQYQLLIVEVKAINALGLQQLSQLIGYSIVSRAQYGLLVNVNGGESPRLTELIRNDKDLLTIDQMMSTGERIKHHFGVMEWDSLTKNLTYTGCGQIGSIPALCEKLSEEFC